MRKLIKLRGDCPDGRTCPAIQQEAAGGNLWITGQLMGSGPSGTTVKVPGSLVPELRPGPDGGVMITGREVTDPDVRAQMAIGPGETGIEVPAEQIPEVSGCDSC